MGGLWSFGVRPWPRASEIRHAGVSAGRDQTLMDAELGRAARSTAVAALERTGPTSDGAAARERGAMLALVDELASLAGRRRCPTPRAMQAGRMRRPRSSAAARTVPKMGPF